eukprot:5118325-Prymnesium_polylepis.2
MACPPAQVEVDHALLDRRLDPLADYGAPPAGAAQQHEVPGERAPDALSLGRGTPVPVGCIRGPQAGCAGVRQMAKFCQAGSGRW